MAEEDKWLPRMTRAFMELDSSTHAIDTAQFAAAMEQVRRRRCVNMTLLGAGCRTPTSLPACHAAANPFAQLPNTCRCCPSLRRLAPCSCLRGTSLRSRCGTGAATGRPAVILSARRLIPSRFWLAWFACSGGLPFAATVQIETVVAIRDKWVTLDQIVAAGKAVRAGSHPLGCYDAN